MRYKHRLLWGSTCEPGFIDITPGAVSQVIFWRHLYGGSEYIYPEIELQEIRRIKNRYQGSRIILIPVLKKRWEFNTGIYGWTELIDYHGLEVCGGEVISLADKNRFVKVYELQDIQEMSPENIEKLFTVRCTISNYFKVKNGEKIYYPRNTESKTLPLYFLLEGANDDFGIVNLWKQDYTKPEIMFGEKKDLVLSLRNPYTEIWLTKNHRGDIKNFLF